MQLVILAGGLGTRISEETEIKPKPMVEIGGYPILWHIMKIYSEFGIRDFIICCGYKGRSIKEYFYNYSMYSSNITIDMSSNEISIHQTRQEPWKITLIDTGESTQTGGRVKRVEHLISASEFCLTYGDGVANINLDDLIVNHRNSSKLLTLTAVRPPARYGALNVDTDGSVLNFLEKPEDEGGWVNGGFMVLNSRVLDEIYSDQTNLEKDVLAQLVLKKEVNAFKHYGFWHPMDTLRDKNFLNNLWESGDAPWKIWE